MKKLLLTLGSATAVVAPLTTVVACGKTEEKKLDQATEIATGVEIKEALLALHIDTDIAEGAFKDAVATNSTEALIEVGLDAENFKKITDAIVEGFKFTSIDTKEGVDSLTVKFTGNGSGTIFEVPLSTNISFDGGATKEELAAATVLTSSLSGLSLTAITHNADTDLTANTAFDAGEAETEFGLVAAEFAKITDAITEKFRFEGITSAGAGTIDVNFANARTGDIYAATIADANIEWANETADLDNAEVTASQTIITAIEGLSVSSTISTGTDLANVIATDATEAESLFGLVTAEFAKITDVITEGFTFAILEQDAIDSIKVDFIGDRTGDVYSAVVGTVSWT